MTDMTAERSAGNLHDLVSDLTRGLAQSIHPGCLLLVGHLSSHRRMSPRPRYHPQRVAVSATAALTQTLTASRITHQLLAAAIPALVAVLGLLTIAVWLPSPSFGVFLAEDIVVGAGAGLMFKGAIAAVPEIASPAHRGRRAIPSRSQSHATS
jgi:hypothetical protein